jgi:phytoene dehydrogenase-like protein
MGFTLPVGGAVALPLALARIVEAGGGSVMLDAEVKEIRMDGGRAAGVRVPDNSGCGRLMPSCEGM